MQKTDRQLAMYFVKISSKNERRKKTIFNNQNGQTILLHKTWHGKDRQTVENSVGITIKENFVIYLVFKLLAEGKTK